MMLLQAVVDVLVFIYKVAAIELFFKKKQRVLILIFWTSW